MFGYICEECGEGKVNKTVINNYETKIKGYAFVVPEATVGICEKCHAKYFAAEETKRWEMLFYEDPAVKRLYSSPTDIERVRKSLGLSMENFAFLIGTTRQSLYNWVKPNRARPQLRIADLMIKLVDKTYYEEKVDVLSFLVEEAHKLGVALEIPQRRKATSALRELILKVKQIPEQLLGSTPMEAAELAAQQDSGREITGAETEDGSIVGKIKYDYTNGDIILVIEKADFDLSAYEAELAMKDGRTISCGSLEIKDGQATLQRETESKPKDIDEIRLTLREASE